MSRKLAVADVVDLVQSSLPESSFAVAYFVSEREYTFHIFESLIHLLRFVRDRDPTNFTINAEYSPRVIDFSIDKWLLFASEDRARRVLNHLQNAFNQDSDDEN